MDIVVSRKLGAPGNPELAIGAVAEDGKVYLNEWLVKQVRADDDYIQQEKSRQLAEIKRRIQSYRVARPKVSIEGKAVIITDDGVATGATIELALWTARQEKPQSLIVALPVEPQEAIERLGGQADEVLCLACPPFFSAISQFYIEFEQTEDKEVLEILKRNYERERAK